MANPIFTFALAHTSRRPWYRRLRWLYVCWLTGLVSVLYLLAWADSLFSWTLPAPVFEEFARRFCDLFLWQQAFLLLVATPAFAAGSITDDKANGTLQHLLTTSLTSGEIIVGKWLAQVIQIGLLALSGLPLFVFLGVFLNLPPLVFLAIFPGLVLWLGGLAAASLLAAVWCRSTTEAVFGLYLGTGAVVAAAVGLGLGDIFYPLHLVSSLEPAEAGLELLRGLAVCFVFWGSLCLVCLGLAAWRLRPAHARQLEVEGKPRVRNSRRPPVGNKPLRWKECYVLTQNAMGKTFTTRWPLWLVWPALMALTFLVGATLVLNTDYGIFLMGPCLLVFLSFIALTVGAGTISGERENQTWDLLLTTTLEPRQLVRGKLWGIMDFLGMWFLAFWPAAFLVSLFAGLEAAFWTALWGGLTWLVTYFAAAVGLECSTRAPSSRRSLLTALASFYLAVFLRLALLGIPMAATIPLVFLGWPLWLAPMVVGLLVLGVACVLTTVALLAEAEMRLERAEKWIQERDRVPQSQPPPFRAPLPQKVVAEQPLVEI